MIWASISATRSRWGGNCCAVADMVTPLGSCPDRPAARDCGCGLRVVGRGDRLNFPRADRCPSFLTPIYLYTNSQASRDCEQHCREAFARLDVLFANV